MTTVEIASLELDLGPDPRVLAVSEFAMAPSPGVVLVDLNGQGMLYSESVWMDEAGHVRAGGWGISSMGVSVADGAVSVTGRAVGTSRVHVRVESSTFGESFEFHVTPTADGWYAGCRPVPDEWYDLEDVDVQVIDRP